MGGLKRIADQQAAELRAREAGHGTAVAQAAVARAHTSARQVPGGPDAASALQRRQWAAIGGALLAMTAVVGLSAWLVLGTLWLGLALGACVAAVALAAWYTVSGRTIGMNGDVRERVLERHYIGVAWYGSMLRTTAERGGYERGLRRELTRLAAARLAERHGVNLYRAPQAAARLIGTDLWPLVDPAMLTSAGSGHPGGRPPEVPIRAVAELIERLERM
jgi:hypothetical protein